MYKSIHEIIGEDNILIIEDMLNDFSLTDNNQKADKIKELLENDLADRGLKELGCGTNRIAFISDKDPHYVYKIALDERGIKDNNLEFKLSKMINPKYITQCIENIGLVAKCERIFVMNKYLMLKYKKQVSEILTELSHDYLLNDVGYTEFLNWGIRNGNEPVILDYAYLRPITQGMNFLCTYGDCGGQLRYTKSFKMFKCVECGYKYSISEVQDPLHMEMDSGMVISDSYLNNNM